MKTPGPGTSSELLEKVLAAVDKKLAKSTLESLIGQVSDKDKPIIQKMIKQLGGSRSLACALSHKKKRARIASPGLSLVPLTTERENAS